MSSEADLTRLLAELKKSGSPLARLKTLSRAWRVVRRLSPEARGRLAAAVGLDGAEGLLESLSARKGRLRPAVLQQALERVRETEPADVQRVVRDLRDGERRRQVFERGADALAAELGLDEEPPAPTAAKPETSPPPSPSAPSTEPPELPVAPEPPESQWPITVTSPPTAPGNAVERERPTPPPPEPVPARPAAGAAELVRQLEEEPRTMRRFRRLREGRARLKGQPVELLRRTLATFPSGWQRRRALLYLLQARLPASPAAALSLIGELESPTGRRWCARTLVAEWELSAPEQAELRERFPGLVVNPRRPFASRRGRLRALK